VTSLRRQIRFTLSLGWLSLVTGICTLLALIGIAHGEPDLSLEWRIIRGAVIVFGLFLTVTLQTLQKALKKLP
jgi:hypothetical protein